MKKEGLMVVTLFFLISLTVITSVYATNDRMKTVTISSDESDITGDGINERISLKGIPNDIHKNYLKEIYISVTTSTKKKIMIPLDSGSKAALKLVDLNKDGVKDIFANVLSTENGDTTQNFLFSLKDFVRKELSVPEPLVMDSSFENGYKAKITIGETGKTYLFNLKDRKKLYKKLGLYYNGKLNEPTELTVNASYKLKPVRFSSGETGLKGIQKITGITNEDAIAFVESSWNYKNNKWILTNAEVHAEVTND